MLAGFEPIRDDRIGTAKEDCYFRKFYLKI